MSPKAIYGIGILIMLATAADLAVDVVAGRTARHMASEVVVLALTLGAIAATWREAQTARALERQLGAELARAQREAETWRREASSALRDFGDAIDRQFDEWQLTESEREVGLALLKGLSMKEIAAARSTSERTVRQQAQELYRKSGLGGRAPFAAFFLQGLLLPREATPSRSSEGRERPWSPRSSARRT